MILSHAADNKRKNHNAEKQKGKKNAVSPMKIHDFFILR
jgi:hypothetical protein